MKKLILLFAATALLSCKKDDPDKQARVTYKIIETTSVVPAYTVTFSAENNSTRTIGPVTTDTWTSETIRDKERGDFVSLTLESSNGTGSYTMQIYMNSVLWQEITVDNPTSPETLSGNLPE